ncbi:hypothetical protein B0H19DRAFT_1192180 [Mycena capillaripes]|nr:hypothetical protein B0H19DRAFT_1192180 [Mycena capillaripes]
MNPYHLPHGSHHSTLAFPFMHTEECRMHNAAHVKHCPPAKVALRRHLLFFRYDVLLSSLHSVSSLAGIS